MKWFEDKYSLIYKRVNNFMNYSAMWYLLDLTCIVYNLIFIVSSLKTKDIKDVYFRVFLIITCLLDTYTLYTFRSTDVYYVDECAYNYASMYNGKYMWSIIGILLTIVGIVMKYMNIDYKIFNISMYLGGFVAYIFDVYYRLNYNNTSKECYNNGNVLKFIKSNKEIKIYTCVNNHDLLMKTIHLH
jgi:hypothetical protein